MSDVRKNDDLDILEAILVCWGRKWIILASVFLGLLTGIAVNHIRDRDWVSTIDLTAIEVDPTWFRKSNTSLDFRQKFYSQNVFDSWKQQVGNTTLLFSDLRPHKLVDGVILSEDMSARLIELKNNHQHDLVFVAHTDNLSILDGLFDYANYVNRLITEEHLSEAMYVSESLGSILSNQFETNWDIADIAVQKLLMDKYIEDFLSGGMMFVIRPASVPKDVSIKSSRILFISCLLSGMSASLFVLLRHYQPKRRDELDTE